ncbi:MAG: LacI family DNA-binding transcriptional regulator [Kineosporiaceae bacterium]
MASRSGRATLATVAASAGVSIATVSKVVNGRSDVGAETRARVESLLKEHEYVSPRADGISRGIAYPTVELVFDGKLNAYGVEIIQGVLETAAEINVSVAFSLRSPELRRGIPEQVTTWAMDLAAAGRRAVIAVVNDVTATDLAALSRAHLPLVVIDPLNLPRARVTSVGSTNFTGGLVATQHLLSLGHRRIAYVGGPPTAACNLARLHGFRAAMEADRAPVPDEYVRPGHFVYADGLLAGVALLDLPVPPTAVFAASDETALGVLEAARARGLRIPADLSVVGFDDTQLARLASPPLTTVRQPLREMGGVALRTALRVADGEQLESHHVELATELVVRSSTALPAGAASAS